MNERPGGDPNPTSPETFRVSPDTYGVLSTLENGHLGNAYTKRLIRVTKDPQKLPYSSIDSNVDLSGEKILVYLRIRQANRFIEGDYVFTVDPEGTVVVVKSWQYGGHGDQKEQEPLSAELFMRHFQTAQKVQPTLKR